MILYENVKKKKLHKLKMTLHVNFTHYFTVCWSIRDQTIIMEIFLDDNFSNTNTRPNQLYCADHRGLFSWAPINSTAYSSLKNAVTQIGFNLGTSHIVSYHITNSTELNVKEISTNTVSIRWPWTYSSYNLINI